MEREATPRLLMKPSIQLYLDGLTLSDTVRVLEIYDVERARSPVHNWVHKVDLQSVNDTTLISDTNDMEIRTVSNVFFVI